MHRTEGDGFVVDSGTGTNRFDPGDPFIPRPATMLTYDWCNAVQEELCAVVAGLGGTVNTAAADTFPQNQLWTRMNLKLGRLDQAQSWAGAQTFSSTVAVTGAATLSSTLGVTGNTTLGGSLAVTATTTLTGAVTANGGATFNGVTTGAGLTGNGGPTNGTGVVGAGVGTGSGINATGGATGSGVVGTGGSTSGYGGVFTGKGSFAGVTSTGGTSGGTGVTGIGGGGNAYGVNGTGSGTFPGVIASPATGATGATPAYSLWVNNGYLQFTNTTSPASTTAISNTLTPANIIKAWVMVSNAAGTVTLLDGFNVTSAVNNGAGTLVVTMATAMASSTYAVAGNAGANGWVYGASQTTTTFQAIVTVGSGSKSLASYTDTITVVVWGRQ